ncbi:tail fiber assembly protein [Gilliamella apis]|nr:hypothetical protein B6C84_02015 [Gilliamella apis]OTQ37896.1 hypothetical protein B6C88_04075 [Gilliamella apis]OTQ40489.1 hypothetical protein B6D26_05485 [Gilliamella apis]OTQ43632.1 hypothetical protein B6C94_02865 [Gilliamella apis]OTQ47323.1 hypothetical protein B6C86_01460 [Gilliamella apis]
MLEDAVYYNVTEVGDQERLKARKKYRILLSRIDTNSVDIAWSIKPK